MQPTIFELIFPRNLRMSECKFSVIGLHFKEGDKHFLPKDSKTSLSGLEILKPTLLIQEET